MDRAGNLGGALGWSREIVRYYDRAGHRAAFGRDDDDRRVDRLDDSLRHAPVHQLRDSGASVRADDDQVDVMFLGVVANHLVDRSFANDREVLDAGGRKTFRLLIEGGLGVVEDARDGLRTRAVG